LNNGTICAILDGVIIKAGKVHYYNSENIEVTMRILIIAIFLMTSAFSIFLKYLTYSRRNAPLPDNVKDIFDEESYKKNQTYQMEKTGYSVISGIVGIITTLLFLLLNFHQNLFSYISKFTGNVFLTGLFIFLIPLLISDVIDTITGIYNTFGIEAKYGFNRTKVETYIADFLKNIIITVLLLGGLLYVFLVLYNRIGNWVFLTLFFIIVFFTFFTFFLSPFIIRIFNKFTPLEECELKNKIEEMAKRTGYKIKGIYTVDGSKRSAKLGAYATGFGITKTIGLFDTLFEKMSDDEIIAVIAHEIGHAKKAHILKSIFPNLIEYAVMLIAAYFIVTMPAVSQAFGFTEVNLAFGIYVLFIMFSPISVILQIPLNAMARKFESEADAFAKEQAGKETIISALKKLNRENMANLTPHPFVVLIEYNHPTVSQRIAAL
jgi:STE24 endopeptidase